MHQESLIMERFPTGKRKKYKKLMKSMPWLVPTLIGVVVFSIPAAVLGIILFGLSFLLLFLFALFVFLGFLYLAYKYEIGYSVRYFYDVTDDMVVLEEGEILPKRSMLSLAKITDVYLSQDVADHELGLSNLHMFSNGPPEVEVVIEGLDSSKSEDFLFFILNKVAEKTGSKPNSVAPPPKPEKKKKEEDNENK